MPAKIGVMGTHGVGKTTFVRTLAARCRCRVAIIEEVARRCPHPVNKKMTLQSQKWILAAQRGEEYLLRNFPGTVICDRTVLDPVVYAMWAYRHNREVRAGGEMRRFIDRALPIVMDWLADDYDWLYWLRPDRGRDVKVPDDGFRDTDRSFQLEVDRIFESVLAGYGIDNYTVIDGGGQVRGEKEYDE